MGSKKLKADTIEAGQLAKQRIAQCASITDAEAKRAAAQQGRRPGDAGGGAVL